MATNFKRWLDSLKPEDFIKDIGSHGSSFILGCERCPLKNDDFCRYNIIEPCDSKLLSWFNSKPRTP